jgi:integrase
MRAIIKNGIRIFRPSEYDSLLEAIYRKKAKYHYREILNALLYTGMRYVELERFHSHPEWFDKKAKAIFLPAEASRKKKRTMRERWVYLSTEGVIHTENFILYVDQLPRRETLDNTLRIWGRNSGLGEKGIYVKSFRKTWESWLVVSYPTALPLIAMSQGHTLFTAMNHYLNIPFTKEDIEEIKIRTAGWSGLRSIKEV